MFLSTVRMALRGSTGSRIHRQVFHGVKRLFERTGQSGTSDIVCPINLVRGSPNGWRPEWFEEDAQFHPGLAVISLAFWAVELKQTNGALVAGSDALRKLELDPVVRRHRDQATAGEASAQVQVPVDCVAHADGFGKAPSG